MFNKLIGSAKAPNKPDLPWRKDAKWVSGILSVVCFFIALPLFTLAEFTDRETSVELSSVVFAASVSPKGLDDEADVAALRALLAQQKGAEVKPIPGLNIRIRGSDIAGMTPRQVRLFMFRQLSEPLWQSGEAGLRLMTENDQVLAGLKAQGMGVLPLLNRDAYQKLDGWGRLFLFLAGVFLILATFGSRGFGYLVTPGVVMVIAALPGMLVVNSFRQVVEATAASVVAPGGNAVAYLSSIAASSLAKDMEKIGQPYLVLMTLGGACLLAAFLGNGVLFVVRQARATVVKLRGAEPKK